MNAIVEVATAKVVVKTVKATVIAIFADFPKVSAPVVVTSTLHVLDILRYSIDAVAPNNYFKEGTALAAA